jgi:polyhydroxyalkanoate synthesis regulator phasin
MASASEGEAAALRARVTALEQRIARLEALVKTVQGELSRVKRG